MKDQCLNPECSRSPVYLVKGGLAMIDTYGSCHDDLGIVVAVFLYNKPVGTTVTVEVLRDR